MTTKRKRHKNVYDDALFRKFFEVVPIHSCHVSSCYILIIDFFSFELKEESGNQHS
jgi:hypothetical protein